MVILFAKDKTLFCCKNLDTKQIEKLSLSEVKERQKDISNVQFINGKLQGKGFNLDKLSEYKSSIGRSYIYKLKVDNKNFIVGYHCIDSNGSLYYVEEKNISKLRKYEIVNAKFFESKGDIKIDILNTRYLDIEQSYKSITYESEDYVNMYKKYKEENLVAMTSRRYDSDYIGFIHTNYGKSISESFMEGHKLIHNLLLKSNITRLVKIYKEFNIDNNNIKVSEEQNKNFYYLVTFETIKQSGTETVISSIIIHREDKRLLNLLKFKQAKLFKTTIDDLENLVSMGDGDRYSSLNEVMSTDKISGLDLNLKSNTLQKFVLRNGYFINTNTDVSMPLRNGIMIGTDRVRNILYVN